MSAQPRMQASHGPDPVLERVEVGGTVGTSLAHVRMAQDYRNASDSNVEIVYTFPLPAQSTLLDVVVALGGKRYRGTVLARAKAEKGYEDAIAEGNTALMVERPEPGLYVMNLGNLMAGESVTVEVELAMLLDWHGNRLRLSLPMTLAPRYDEARSKLQDHQKPQVGLLVERRFSLDLKLSDDFARAKVASPTHRIATKATEAGIDISLQRGDAWMDRDFVLVAESDAPPRPFGCVVGDGEGHLFYGSFQIPAAKAAAPSRSVKVVLDCSGSMAGDSIGIARTALVRLLEKLRPEDRFGLVAFGSQPLAWDRAMRPAAELDVEAALRWVRERNADMGGTEMVKALDCAISIDGGGASCDLFLITDGEIARTDELVNRARAAGHRIFVIGVGAAPQEDPLRAVAETTGGAIEWVTPGEFLTDAVHRHFSRLTEAVVSDLRLVTDGGFEWHARTPALSAFSGDTVHYFGKCSGARGPVAAEWTLPGKTTRRVALAARASVSDADRAVIPRIAAAMKIRDLQLGGEAELEASELAVKYQLVTAFTNYLLVVERGEAAATAMPGIKQVSHMMAKGWGGVGSHLMLSASRDLLSSPSIGYHDADLGGVEHLSLGSIDDEVGAAPPATLTAFLSYANARHASLVNPVPLARSIADLGALGLPADVASLLRPLAATATEEEIVLAFWAAVLSRAADFTVSRGLRRALASAGLPEKAQPALVAEVIARLAAWLQPLEIV